MKSIAFTLLLILFLGSCTIEKRLYNKGYHIEFNHKGHTKVDKQLADKQQSTNRMVHSESISEATTINETMVTDQLLPDTVGKSDTILFVVAEAVPESVSLSFGRSNISRTDEELFNRESSYATGFSKTVQPIRTTKKDTKRFVNTKKMTRSEFGEKIVNFLLLLLVVGLIVLGVAFPEVGAILVTLLVIGLIVFIVWLISEIMNFFIDLLSFSWL